MGLTPDTSLAEYRAHLRAKLAEHDVPESLHEGLVEYFAARRPVGGFLRAVLENNLVQACARADPYNRPHVADLMFFLVNHVPGPSWGSHAAVEAWLADEEPPPIIFE